VAKANGTKKHKRRPIDDPFHFPTGVASWILGNRSLLEGLVALRDIGPEGEEAVEALLAVRRVAVLSASIQLYYQLAITEGLDPQDEMDLVIPRPVFEWLQHALWGVEPDEFELHLV
jgi:hypothetical protein